MALRDRNLSATPLNQNAWELSKENIEPLKHGRHVDALNESLAQDKQTLLRQKAQLEAQLQSDLGPDPMAAWHRYLTWVEQHFPQGAGREFRGSLEACMKQFMEDDRYANDKRWLYCWLKMAQCSQRVGKLNIYAHMQAQGHCVKLAAFYKQWAWDAEAELEANGSRDFSSVIRIFEDGLAVGAEPREELIAAKSDFELRLARFLARCQPEEGGAGGAEEDTRNILGLLHPVKGGKGELRAPVMRHSSMTQPGLSVRAHQRFHSAREPGPSGNQPFEVFSDAGPGTSSGLGKNPAEMNSLELANLGLNLEKENLRDPSQWPSQKLGRGNGTVLGVGPAGTGGTAKLGFSVFTDTKVAAKCGPDGKRELFMFRSSELFTDSGREIASIEERLAIKWMQRNATSRADLDAKTREFEITLTRKVSQKSEANNSKRKGLAIRKEDVSAPPPGGRKLGVGNLGVGAINFGRQPDVTLDGTMTTDLKQAAYRDMFQTLNFSSFAEQPSSGYLEEPQAPAKVAPAAPAQEGGAKDLPFAIFVDNGQPPQPGAVLQQEDKENVPPPDYVQFKEPRAPHSAGILAPVPGYAEAYAEEVLHVAGSSRALTFDPSHGLPSRASGGSGEGAEEELGQLDLDPNESTVAKFGRFTSGLRRANSTPVHGAFSLPPPTVFSMRKPGDVPMPSPEKIDNYANELLRDADDIGGAQQLEPIQPIPMMTCQMERMSMASGDGPGPSSDKEQRPYMHPTTPGMAYQQLPKQAALSVISETSREYRSGSSSSGSSSGATRTTQAASSVASVHKLETVMEMHNQPMTPGLPGDLPSRCVDTGPKSIGGLGGRKNDIATPGSFFQAGKPAYGQGHGDAVRRLSLEEQPEGGEPSCDRNVLAPRGRVSELDFRNQPLDERVERTGFGLTTRIRGGINPFDEEFQMRIITHPRVRQRLNCLSNYHLFLEANLPKIQIGDVISPGGQKYAVQKLLGSGAFAMAFKCIELEGDQEEVLCIKVQKPAAYWEFYICEELRRRLKQLANSDPAAYAISNPVVGSIMIIHDAYIYADGSLLVNDFHAHGTLLDLVNGYKTSKLNQDAGGRGHLLHEMVVIYFLLEMLKIVEYLHKVQIIHADLKPDNFLLRSPIPEVENTGELREEMEGTCLKLIDFGRAIDMTVLRPGTTFTGTADTSGFQCPEMVDNRPWSYQTDYYCILATIYVLIFGKYMKFRKRGDEYVCGSTFSRKWNAALWKQFFGACLNIPSADELPDLAGFRQQFQEYLFEWLQRPGSLSQWNAEAARMEQILGEREQGK